MAAGLDKSGGDGALSSRGNKRHSVSSCGQGGKTTRAGGGSVAVSELRGTGVEQLV